MAISDFAVERLVLMAGPGELIEKDEDIDGVLVSTSPSMQRVIPLRKRRDIAELVRSTDLSGSLRFRCGLSRAGGWARRAGRGAQALPPPSRQHQKFEL